MNLSRFKHFLIGALAVIAPAAVTAIESPTVQHFISAHPSLAVYFPIMSGVIVQLYHELTTPKAAPAAPTAKA